jgi:hypothetical protein
VAVVVAVMVVVAVAATIAIAIASVVVVPVSLGGMAVVRTAVAPFTALSTAPLDAFSSGFFFPGDRSGWSSRRLDRSFLFFLNLQDMDVRKKYIQSKLETFF